MGDLLGGSWNLVSKVISTLIGVISIVTLIITLVTKSHDPLSTGGLHASGFRVYIGFGLWSPALIFLLGFGKSVCTCEEGGEVPLRSGQSTFCNSVFELQSSLS